jgi:hypothetical protein
MLRVFMISGCCKRVLSNSVLNNLKLCVGAMNRDYMTSRNEIPTWISPSLTHITIVSSLATTSASTPYAPNQLHIRAMIKTCWHSFPLTFESKWARSHACERSVWKGNQICIGTRNSNDPHDDGNRTYPRSCGEKRMATLVIRESIQTF